MEPLHCTPSGPGSPLTRAERRAAWLLIDETIRHELAERHARHWPRYRPSTRRRLTARLAARGRRLVVITDCDQSGRQIVAAATARRSSPRFGRSSALALAVARCWTKPTIMLASVVMVLAIRHGHTGLGDLAAFSLVATVTVHPVLSAMRLRLQDRVLAARMHLLATSCSDQHKTLVLHQLTFPQPAMDQSEVAAARLTAVAMEKSVGTACVAAPCCDALGDLYAACEGVTWVSAHGPVERSALVFATAEFQRDANGSPSAERAVVALAEFKEKLGRTRTFEPA